MKLFYATGNNSKIYNMRRRLNGTTIKVITPKDLNIKVEIDESGETLEENALIKAKGYYNALIQNGIDIPIVAGDSGFYIDGIPDGLQPGIYVRRVKGYEMTDDEMIEYYSNLVKQFSETLPARNITALALIINGKSFTELIPDDDVLFSSKPNTNKIHRGNPLDVLMIEPKSGCYYNELSDEQAITLAGSFDKKCLKFLNKHLNLLTK